MRILESFNQAFVAYAVSIGVKLVGVVPGEWIAYQLDDSGKQASRALGLWCDNRALVNAKDYANSMRYVRRVTNEHRTTEPIKGECVPNGNRAN